jgi:hypothetical protein
MLDLNELVIGNKFWSDGRALKTCKVTLKYVGKKYVIWESISGREEWSTINFFREWATKA